MGKLVEQSLAAGLGSQLEACLELGVGTSVVAVGSQEERCKLSEHSHHGDDGRSGVMSSVSCGEKSDAQAMIEMNHGLHHHSEKQRPHR